MAVATSISLGESSPEEWIEHLEEAVPELMQRLSTRAWRGELDEMEQDAHELLGQITATRLDMEADPRDVRPYESELIGDAIKSVSEVWVLEPAYENLPEGSKRHVLLGRIRKLRRDYTDPLHEELQALAALGEELSRRYLAGLN